MSYYSLGVISALILPTFIFLHGLYVLLKIRKTDDVKIGYISKMSLKNKDTWRFANKVFGIVWIVMGLFFIIGFTVVNLLTAGNDDLFIAMGVIENICLIILMWLSIKLIDKIIYKKFDNTNK